jgi:hypothetical protein
MSEASLEKSPKEIMNDLERAIVDGWYRGRKRSSFSPWASAYLLVDDIKRYMNYYGYNSEELIHLLAIATGNDYKTLKQMWSKLSAEQRFLLTYSVTSNIALIGVRELFEWIAKKLSDKKYKKVRAKVLQDARRYLNGEIGIGKYDLMKEIAGVFWPTKKYDNVEYCDELVENCDDYLEKCYDEENKCYEYKDFMKGVTLALSYVTPKDFDELVKKYLVEGLENPE